MSKNLPDYEIRMLDISTLRQMFMQYVSVHANDPLVKKMILMDEVETTFTWVIEASIQNVVGRRVERHHHYDLGEYAYSKLFDMFDRQMHYTLMPLKLQDRAQFIKEIKLMVVSNILITAIEPK